MYIALDTETTGLGYWDEAFCISEAWRSADGELLSEVWFELDDLHNWKDLKTTELVFHNAKFDVQKLALAGVISNPNWSKIHDTECLSHLVNEQQPKALKRLAKDLLGLETNEAEVLRAARSKLKLRKADGYHALPREVIEPYARKDAEFTLLLFEKLWPIVSEDEELLRLYREEQELMQVLYEMEGRGLGVDMKYVNQHTKELAGEILRIDLHVRDMVGDEDFNAGSWQQITAALEERGHKIGSTKKSVLASLDDELAQNILELRHLNKLYGTYFKALQAETRDGVLHPNFKQWGTRGRRFSAGANEEG